MFVRVKGKEPNRYLQIVENRREGKRTLQRVVATLGRVDELAGGGVDALLISLSRFAGRVQVLEGYRQGNLEAGASRQIGPDLVFGRLWRELGLDRVLTYVLRDRGFEFPVERAVYLTVLHRLFESGSDRAAEKWRRDVRSPGPRTWVYTTSTGPCGGWATIRMRWKRPCFGVAGICSPICPWPFLTLPACILRGRAGKAWGNSATPRITGRIVAR